MKRILVQHLCFALTFSSIIGGLRAATAFTDANWTSLSALPGTDSRVSAIAQDGSGNLYIGGEFLAVETTVVHRIARWNGTEWNDLGGGVNGPVRALAISGNDVYVGGEFTMATNTGGAAIVANRIAKWNGTSWSALGQGMNSNVLALIVAGSEVYAGGQFTMATNGGGGIAANRVAKWDGTSWSPLGGGVGGDVRALAVSSNDVYVGGDFIVATNSGGGAVTVNRIARWNGTGWFALGAGVNNFVATLAASGSNLYVGGEFGMATNTGGAAVTTSYVANWNGNSWAAMGSGMNARVSVLTTLGNSVYAGGYFTMSGVNVINHLAHWNGTSWTSGSTGSAGMNGNVYALSVTVSTFYAGGDFTTAGSIVAKHIARYNGNFWVAFGNGFNSSVNAWAKSGTNLYAGGYFTTAGTNVVNCVARWDGNQWSALGLGMNSNVQALAILGTNLYAAGDFTIVTNAGVAPMAASRVARWNGTTWSAMGSGMNDTVLALAVLNTNLYAGGGFINAGGTSARFIARWNGSSWSAGGAGLNGAISALASSETDLYAGGSFTWATNSGPVAVRVNYLAKFDGTNWSPMGLGVNSTVNALAVSASNVYAGGMFVRATNIGGNSIFANYVAKWDGNNWSAMASGLNFWVYSLATSANDLYVGGWFSRATNNANVTVPTSAIAKWNGAEWSALGSGMGGGNPIPLVKALTVSGTDLYVGGSFSIAGGKVAANVARANLDLAVLGGRFSNLTHSTANGFSFTFLDASVGEPYRIQSSPSLISPAWTDFTNFIYTNPIPISVATASTNRFFRAVSP